MKQNDAKSMLYTFQLLRMLIDYWGAITYRIVRLA